MSQHERKYNHSAAEQPLGKLEEEPDLPGGDLWNEQKESCLAVYEPAPYKKYQWEH